MKDVREETTVKYDFILSSLGFEEEPLDQRAVVLCRILSSLNIEYKKYYTVPGSRSMRQKPFLNEKWSNMDMVFIAECDENYAEYAKYLFKQKMQIIKELNGLL